MSEQPLGHRVWNSDQLGGGMKGNGAMVTFFILLWSV